MTDTVTEVFGRPVHGTITETTTPVKQDDPQLFIDALDALLNLPAVHSVRWEQYTPYFNDGDPCEFRVGEIQVKLNDERLSELGDYENGYLDLWSFNPKNSYEDARIIRESFSGDTLQEITDALSALARMGLTKHYDFLKTSFGDHAAVTATREGFDVEFHEHD